MRAVVIQSPWNVTAVERGILRPEKGGVLLKVIRGDIYGSNLASYQGVSACVNYPRAIDHGFAAKVVEIEDNVYGVKPGMIVMGNPYFNCGTCYSCRRDMMSCCVHNEAMDIQREGTLSDYLTMPIGRLYGDQDVDPRGLALIEPFYISCRGVSRASVKLSDKVLVLGVGATGTLVDVAVESSGARVYITDIAGEEVEAVVRGFHLDGDFVNKSRKWLDAFVQEITDGDGFGVTAEAVGVPPTLLDYVQAMAGRGRAVVIGTARHSAGFNLLGLQHKGPDMHGLQAAMAVDSTTTMKLVKDRFVDLKKLISKTYPAGSTAEAFRDPGQNYGEIIRVEFEF